ncbi:MAG: SurA N-terminal domain-containing protein [Planctomycetes bacterium]|nr:SurA N-terminal domain-containing protein [Planctomycetota bacterium]
MRWMVVIFALLLLLTVSHAQQTPKIAHGKNEILAIIDGEPITYQQIVGRLDLAAEIRTLREVRRIPDSVTDSELEHELVYGQLETFIVKRLLTAEAERIGFLVSDNDLRAQIARERTLLNIAEGDETAWANYTQQKFGCTPSEYRERRREEIRQNQILYLCAGAQGPVPSQYPISVYVPMSVTPREIKAAFDKERDRYKIATKIDYQLVKLIFPRNTMLDDRKKLVSVLQDAHSRIKKGEGVEAAMDGLKTLIEGMPVAGLKLVVGKRETAADDSKLTPLVYKMVISVPREGGVAEFSAVVESDEAGNEFEGYQFIKLYSKVEGSSRRFDDPKVQGAITESLRGKKLDENMTKVQSTLLKRAVIVPERLIAR